MGWAVLARLYSRRAEPVAAEEAMHSLVAEEDSLAAVEDSLAAAGGKKPVFAREKGQREHCQFAHTADCWVG